MQGGTRAPHWISLSPPLEPIASKESAKNMSNASYRPFEAAKSHEVAVKPSSEGFANGASEQ